MDVLIGYTGFVGSNLLKHRSFDVLVNSKNIDDLANRSFDTVVCCGVSAVKWLANKDPQSDAEGIARLTRVLETIQVRKFVHISTVDVYGAPNGQDESDAPATEGLHPYGLHRLQLENKIAELFEDSHILRLAALFGPGLRKNVIFDLMNDNLVENIDPAASFQWYPVRRLGSDIETAVEQGIRLAHLMPEPIKTQDILSRYFKDAKVGTPSATPARYDLQTKFGAKFGGAGRYVLSAEAVLDEIGVYLNEASDA